MRPTSSSATPTPNRIDFAPPPRRAHVAPRTGFSAPTGGAEQMSPDPVVDDDDDD